MSWLDDPAQAAEQAQRFERQLVDHPENASEVVFELAVAYRVSGDAESAERVLREVVARGGPDAVLARVDLAEMYVDTGQDDRADAELTMVRKQRSPRPEPHVRAAEMLNVYGRHKQALRWFDIAMMRFADLDELDPEWAYVSTVLLHRRALREKLGLVPDDMDRLAEEAEEGDPPV